MLNCFRPFSFLYGILARADRRRKLRRSRSFPVPVVSVGGITAGGSGKTPVVQALIRQLQPEYEVVLLSRGYGRKSKEPIIWSSGERIPNPDLIGDEPALLARSISKGMIGVGSDRGKLLEHILLASYSNNPPKNLLVLLDDGFQHARLNRDLDIVLVDDRTAAERFLLPAGYLRENHSALGRADVLLTTSPEAEAFARHYVGNNGEILELHFRTGPIRQWKSSKHVGQEQPEGKNVLLVTGIAHPERVRASAQGAGYRIAAHLRFRDHHRYGVKDIQRILSKAHDFSADIVLTTEKDAVKLEGRLERYPALGELLYVLPLEANIPEIEQIAARIRTIAGKRK